MKRTMLNIVMMVVAVQAANAALVINDFRDLINAPSGTLSQVITMQEFPIDNLMIRDKFGVASTVPNDGIEIWRIGFAKNNPDGSINFGGYANNVGQWQWAGEEGFCHGSFYNHVFADGSMPDDVYVIHDLLGDGIGTLDNGAWTLGLDDTLYTTGQIEFNGIQGDISQMMPLNYIQPNILPTMTVVVPEPATLILVGLGGLLIRRKSQH